MPNGRVHRGLHLRHLLQEWLNLTMLVRDSFWLALQTACLSPSRNPLKMWREKKRDPQLTIAHDHPIAHPIHPPWFPQHDSAWIGFLSTTYLPRIFLAVFTIYMFAFVADLCIFCTVYTIFYMYASPLLIPSLLVYVTQKSGSCRDHKDNKYSEKIVQGSRGKFHDPNLLHISQLSAPDFQDHPLPQVRHMLLFKCKLHLSSG